MLTPKTRNANNSKHVFQGRNTPKHLVPKTPEEARIVDLWRSSPADKGSVDVEIGLLSDQIVKQEQLLKKLLDMALRREFYNARAKLIQMVHSRRSKLNYLLNTDSSRYFKAIQRLKMSA